MSELNFIKRFETVDVECFNFKGKALFNPYHVGKCLKISDSNVRNYLAKMNENQAIILKNSDVQDMDFRKIGEQGIDVLIGMDVISKGDFAISNYNGKTQFSFRIPSQNDVDYKAEANIE